MKHFKLLIVGAALALSAITPALAGSLGNASEGSAIRDNPALVGGRRGDGKVQLNTESVTVVSSTAAETSHVIKATPGLVFWFEAYNGNAAIRYIQLHNAVSLPANGAVPILSVPAAITSNVNRSYRPAIWCSVGCVIANSTTQATLTIGSADNFFTVGAR